VSRRVSLPGADELFRTTGGMALQASAPADRRRNTAGDARVPAPAGESDPVGDAGGTSAAGTATTEEHSAADPDSSEAPRPRGADPDQEPAQAPADRAKSRRAAAEQPSAPAGSGAAVPQQPQGREAAAQAQQRRRGGRGANRRPSGRERHDEKITVYVSAEELMDLEHARLVLRGEHGLAVDRGRIVREAVAVVLADLESRGDASILVRRLRGR
jgi:hypothetical protein